MTSRRTISPRPERPAQTVAKKATPRQTYDDRTKAISDKARALACPQSKQGPVSKQVADVMRDLKDPRKAIASVGLSQKQMRALANGDGDADSKGKLRELAKRVNGAPQWTRGRPLAATLTAWLEQR